MAQNNNLINPDTVYPAVKEPSANNNGAYPAAPQNMLLKSNSWSLALFLLLLLTFFSPLGSTLFLPIVLVGIFGAYKHVQAGMKASNAPISTPKRVAFTVFKIIMIIGTVFVLGIVALIGLLFLLIGTGSFDGNMGS
jgi:hypothetical protein